MLITPSSRAAAKFCPLGAHSTSNTVDPTSRLSMRLLLVALIIVIFPKDWPVAMIFSTGCQETVQIPLLKVKDFIKVREGQSHSCRCASCETETNTLSFGFQSNSLITLVCASHDWRIVPLKGLTTCAEPLFSEINKYCPVKSHLTTSTLFCALNLYIRFPLRVL